jgi:hypothetical protein
MACDETHDVHDFRWADGMLICARCGTVDISGQRLVRRVKRKLEAEGVTVDTPD